jgi:hypothetical protein
MHISRDLSQLAGKANGYHKKELRLGQRSTAKWLGSNAREAMQG